MTIKQILGVSLLTTVMTNFANSAVRCAQLFGDPLVWVTEQSHFETIGRLQIRGYRRGQYLSIAAKGNLRKATEIEKAESLKNGWDSELSGYRPISGTLEQARESIPWFLDVIDEINSFAPRGSVPTSLDIIIRLDSNRNGQLSWFGPDEIRKDFHTGSRILMSLKVVNAPAKFGEKPRGIDVPKNIIQIVFAHEYGHALFTQLMRQRGLDYDRALQEINKRLDDRYLDGLQKVEKELGTKSGDTELFAESLLAYVYDPTNRDSLIRQKRMIRNLISPYSELFADVVDALFAGDLKAHSEAIQFYQSSVPLARALFGEVKPESYQENFMGTTRSFLESGNEKQNYDTKNLELWHEALDPVRVYLGKSGLISKKMTPDQKRAFLNQFINEVVAEVKAKAPLVTADSFPAERMSADLIERLKRSFRK